MIACENTLPGDPPSDWQVNGAGDPSIQGFATQMSVTSGQTESFKINTTASSYHIDILRVGYYQGNGARKVVSNMQPTATLPQSQPACQNDSAPTGLIDCGNWAVSASWTVPSDAVSGLYLAHLVRNDTGGESLIPFVVRDDASHSDILFQTADETWQAYNSQGGNSLYSCTINCPPGNPQAYKGAAMVSYNRPWHSAELMILSLIRLISARDRAAWHVANIRTGSIAMSEPCSFCIGEKSSTGYSPRCSSS